MPPLVELGEVASAPGDGVGVDLELLLLLRLQLVELHAAGACVDGGRDVVGARRYGLVRADLTVLEVQRPRDPDDQHQHRRRGHRRMGDERLEEPLEPADVLRAGRRARPRGSTTTVGFLKQQRRHRLRRLDHRREDPAVLDRLASPRHVIQRDLVGGVRLEVLRQPLCLGGRQLAVERADQQRIEILAFQHDPSVLILRVPNPSDEGHLEHVSRTGALPSPLGFGLLFEFAWLWW